MNLIIGGGKKSILGHFKKVDPVLYEAAMKFKVQLHPNTPAERYFEKLCREIVGQQLSTKVSEIIWRRFSSLIEGESVEPEEIIKMTGERLRGAGLSNAKVKYIKGLAQAVKDKQIDFLGLDKLENEEVIEQLITLKGVGRWTAEMFLMFTLGRGDVFSAGDLGLKRAMEKLYGLTDPSRDKMTQIANAWSPFRTYACMVLWESLDNNPG